MDSFVLFSLGRVLFDVLRGLCFFEGDVFGSWVGLESLKTQKHHGFLFVGCGWIADWLSKMLFWLFSRLYRGWVHLGWIGNGLIAWIWKLDFGGCQEGSIWLVTRGNRTCVGICWLGMFGEPGTWEDRLGFWLYKGWYTLSWKDEQGGVPWIWFCLSFIACSLGLGWLFAAWMGADVWLQRQCWGSNLDHMGVGFLVSQLGDWMDATSGWDSFGGGCTKSDRWRWGTWLRNLCFVELLLARIQIIYINLVDSWKLFDEGALRHEVEGLGHKVRGLHFRLNGSCSALVCCCSGLACTAWSGTCTAWCGPCMAWCGLCMTWCGPWCGSWFSSCTAWSGPNMAWGGTVMASTFVWPASGRLLALGGSGCKSCGPLVARQLTFWVVGSSLHGQGVVRWADWACLGCGAPPSLCCDVGLPWSSNSFWATSLVGLFCLYVRLYVSLFWAMPSVCMYLYCSLRPFGFFFLVASLDLSGLCYIPPWSICKFFCWLVIHFSGLCPLLKKKKKKIVKAKLSTSNFENASNH
ncbi:hypothetical protein R6Q59_030975 [Mikania micrantha]